MNRDIKVTSWRLEPCEVLINVMHSLAHPPKITTSRHCNLRNASLPAIFIGLGNYGRDYFVPLTDALSSTDTNFLLHIYHLGVLQNTGVTHVMCPFIHKMEPNKAD